MPNLALEQSAGSRSLSRGCSPPALRRRGAAERDRDDRTGHACRPRATVMPFPMRRAFRRWCAGLIGLALAVALALPPDARLAGAQPAPETRRIGILRSESSDAPDT